MGPLARGSGNEPSRGVDRQFSLELLDVFAHLAEENAEEARQEAINSSSSPSLTKSSFLPSRESFRNVASRSASPDISQGCASPRRRGRSASSRRSKRLSRERKVASSNQQNSKSTTSGLLMGYLSYNSSIRSEPPAVSDEANRAELFLESFSKTEAKTDDEVTASSSRKIKRKVERDGWREKMRERMRRERDHGNISQSSRHLQPNAEKPKKNVASREQPRIMLKQPSQRELDLSFENQDQEAMQFSKSNASLEDIDFVSSDGEEDAEEDEAEEDAGAPSLLQFDPTQTDGSASMVSISGLRDAMFEAQQHQPLPSSSQPLFDFLEDSPINPMSHSTPSKRSRQPRRKKKSDQKKTLHHGKQLPGRIVDETQDYAQFFKSNNEELSSPRSKRSPKKEGGESGPVVDSISKFNGSWPPRKQKARSKSPKRRKSKKKPPTELHVKHKKRGKKERKEPRTPAAGTTPPSHKKGKPKIEVEQEAKSPGKRSTPVRKKRAHGQALNPSDESSSGYNSVGQESHRSTKINNYCASPAMSRSQNFALQGSSSLSDLVDDTNKAWETDVETSMTRSKSTKRISVSLQSSISRYFNGGGGSQRRNRVGDSEEDSDTGTKGSLRSVFCRRGRRQGGRPNHKLGDDNSSLESSSMNTR